MFVISVLYAKISLTAKTQNQISFLPSFRCRSPARKTHITLRKKKKQQTRSAKTAQALQLYMRCTCSSLSLASLLSLRVTGTHISLSLARGERDTHLFFSSSLRLFFRGCIMCMRIMCVRIEWVCYRGVRARRMGSDVMGLSWNDRICFFCILNFSIFDRLYVIYSVMQYLIPHRLCFSLISFNTNHHGFLFC